MNLKPALLFVLVVTGGCGGDPVVDEILARQGIFPATFQSNEAALKFLRYSTTRGHVENVRIGLRSYLVVFRHGSGLPTTGIAVYRRHLWEWQLVSEPRPPAPESFRTKELDGKIVVVGERSGREWTIFEPK